MARERDDGGKYVEQITQQDILEVFKKANLPVLTANEVAEVLDCSRSAAYYKLENLVEENEIQKKKVGARAVVYIRLEE